MLRCGKNSSRRTSQILAASFEQLHLPWLAPAQLRWASSHASSAPSHRSSHRRPSASRSHAQTRSLATAADLRSIRPAAPLPPSAHATAFRSAGDDHVPFDFARPEPAEFPQLGRFRDDPVILNLVSKSPDQLIKIASGFTGTAQQLLMHLHTSLSVGRRDRAQTITQRLFEQCGPEAPETLHAHTAYLEDLLGSLAAHGRDSPKSQDVLKEMQRWFEVEVCNKSVALDDRILVAMVRASIRSLEGSRRERSIRRYVEMASHLGDDVLEEVLGSEDYDDNEFVVLQRATADYDELPDELPAEALEPASQQVDQDHSIPQEESAKVAQSPDLVEVDTLPEVLETEQKGTGLEAIKRTMRALTDITSLPPDASPEAHLERAHARQKILEETSVDVAIDRWHSADEDLKKLGIHTAMQSKPLAALMWQWHQALLPALEAELEEVRKELANDKKHKASDRLIYGPHLELLDLRTLAASTILFTMQKMAAGKNRATNRYSTDLLLNQLTASLGNAIESECHVHSHKKQYGKGSQWQPKKAKRRQTSTETPPAEASETKATSKKRKSAKQAKAMLAQLGWGLDMKVKLGAMLVSKLIESAQLPVTREHPRTKQQITQMQPAFLHRINFVRGRKLGVVLPNPALVTKLQSEPLGSVIAKRMPMVVEPRPWESWSKGGYLYFPNNILRLPHGDNSGKDYFMAADEQGELGTIYKGLNALGKTPWKIHRDVFKVQLEAWNSGEAIANFAPLEPDIPIPPEPANAGDPSVKREWLIEVQAAQNKKSGIHSKRCFQNFQMEVARTVLNETLYFPHNMDFRGRAYPIPPYLNHMGADNVRGLLTFAEGKPLGEGGLRWLKIHLATAAGHDKASMSERVEFTMAHLDDIYDSVRNPLGGRRWWLQADDAWQTLAACFELTQALDSPDPTQFVSCLPIQQDGTCNGLQHYAALGGDKAGAAQVNLEPSDRPADVYTAVADAVKVEVEKDAEAGNPIAQKLSGRLTRKCVKQPVMTNVYGVTFYGARQQVAKQLDSIFPEVKAHDDVNIANMAHYVATKIFKSLGDMFAGAQAIQSWLGQCADRISTCLTPEQMEQLKTQTRVNRKVAARPKGKKAKKSEDAEVEAEAQVEAEVEAVDPGKVVRKRSPNSQEAAELEKVKPLFRSTVVWTTPLRLPVVQPYRSSKSRIITTGMQNLSMMEPQVWDPVSKRKQLQAFPPNFIHSLDATHMLLSAIECTERGMTFASIHDSFWSHACDVDQLSTVLRDAFVAMHSEDIIGRLKEEFEARYKGSMYLATVFAHSEVGQRITERRAEMKKDKSTKLSELALEVERIRLVNSENAEERAKGLAMTTPGSIFESEADQSAFALPSEMVGQMLGEIPSTPNNTMSPVVEGDEEDVLHETEELTAEERQAFFVAQKSAARTKAAKKAREERKIFVWLPITFPEVPKRGDFDVRRLKDSQYFFH